MRKNPSSDVPRARGLLLMGLKSRDWRYVKAALPLLFRAKAARRAKPKRSKITPAQMRATRRIAAREPDTSLHEITNRVGLPNAGRASEIVNWKRR